MAEELQSLLDKINEDGIKKANLERDRILKSANDEAKVIRERAKTDADKILADAANEADNLQKRGESALKQAARDIVLALKVELEKRLKKAIGTAAEQALTPQFMAELIREMAVKFAAGTDSEIAVLTSGKDAAALEKALNGVLAGSLRNQPKVFPNPEIKSGLEVSFNGDQIYYDFTSEAITQLLCAYIGPKLAKLIEDQE